MTEPGVAPVCRTDPSRREWLMPVGAVLWAAALITCVALRQTDLWKGTAEHVEGGTPPHAGGLVADILLSYLLGVVPFAAAVAVRAGRRHRFDDLRLVVGAAATVLLCWAVGDRPTIVYAVVASVVLLATALATWETRRAPRGAGES